MVEYSDRFKQKVVAMMLSLGPTVAAETFGISRTTVHRWKSAYDAQGVTIEPAEGSTMHVGQEKTGRVRRTYSKKFREEAVASIGDRLPEDVATELGVPARTLRRWLTQSGQ